LAPRTKNDGLPSCESKRKGIRGLLGRGKYQGLFWGVAKNFKGVSS